jgi:hypothetical protein
VATAGDVNGDDAADVMAGGYMFSGNAGRVDLFYSTCGTVDTNPVVWSGGAGAEDMRFSRCDNWLERCPEEGDELFFPDTPSLFPTNDMIDVSWRALTFSNSTDYMLGGEVLPVQERISLLGDNSVTLASGVEFAGDEAGQVELFCSAATLRVEQVSFDAGTAFAAGGGGTVVWPQVDSTGASLLLTGAVTFAQQAINAFSAVTVRPGATFAAQGQVATLALQGQLETVFDGVPGTLRVSSAAIHDGSTLRHTVSENGIDLLRLNGAMAFYGTVNVLLSSDGSGTVYKDHTLIDYTSGVVGAMPTWNLQTDIPGLNMATAVVTNDTVNRVIKITGLRPAVVELTNAVVSTEAGEVALYVETTPGQRYDLITIDASTYSDSLSNTWQMAEELQAEGSSVVFSNSVVSLQPSELRLFRVAPAGAWQADVSSRSASPEVFVAQKIRMYPGRNWVSFAGIPPSMSIGDVFPNGLPHGPSAASSACVYLYDLAQSANPTGAIWYNGISWQFKDSGEPADHFELPLLQGLVVSMPPETTGDVTVITRLRTNTQVRAIAGQGRETFVSINLPGYMHPADMNLVESGFSGSSRATRSDQLCKWDRKNQRIQDNIWYWFDTRTSQWKTTANKVLAHDQKPFAPDDAVIIKTSTTSPGFDWVLPVYYTPPTAEMTP